MRSPRNSRKVSALGWRAALVAMILVPFAAQATTFTVNSSADSGGTCPGATCTLRQAILTAGSGDTIDFASGITTIDLTTGELLINTNLTILGSGANTLTVRRAGGNFRIFNIASGTVTISGLTISNGLPSGGFSAGGILNQGSLTVDQCAISGNTVFGGGNGGGILNEGSLTVDRCTISGNTVGTSSTSSGLGGGIANSGTLSVTNSTISGNSCSYGGGGLLNSGGAATATLTNCTLSDNLSKFIPGGGVTNNSGTVTLTNCTIATNLVGGGVSGTMTARNTIIAKNTDNGARDVTGTLTSQGYNLIGVIDGGTITPAQPTDQVGNGAAPVDSMLGPLQDNGGPTQTHALLSGSRARDKGESSGSTTDQRGFTRPVDNPLIPNAAGGDGSDIGAFETQAGLTAKSLNISTRARVQTGNNVMIAGFIITGNVPKQVILRGLGPSLVNAGVPVAEVLNDPVLELHGASGSLITSNDNWKDSPERAQFEGTAFQPSDDRESVILTTLPPASYTVVLKGVANSTGVGTVEVYDLDQSSDSTLTNISSRALVETGNSVVIAGFNLGGNSTGSPQIIIRGLGPSLGAFGIANPLANPTLELRDANANLLAANDNWKDNPFQSSQVTAAGLQPQDDLEAAIAAGLPPGAYTAILAGQGGGTGVGTVEVYNLQ